MLKENLSPEILNAIAREAHFVERSRKVSGYQMFWSVVGGFCVGQATQIAGMLRAFVKDTGIFLNYSAWHKRLSKPGFPEFMRRMVEHLLDHIYSECFPKKKFLGKFKDICMQDGSSFAVNNTLQNIFPGRFTKTAPAAVELHAYYSLRRGSIDCVHVAADSISEYHFMPEPKDIDMEDVLILFDRGYFSLEKLRLIDKNNGFFITRLKTSINPLITGSNRKSDPNSDRFYGKLFQDIKLKKKKDYDFTVVFNKMFGFKKLRLIAIWDERRKKHILLLSNAWQKKLTLAEIGSLYRLRWQIELIFKELKSHTEMRKFFTGNENITEGFIWASLCAQLIRRFLLASAQQDSPKRLSFHKAAISAKNFMPEFIACAIKQFQKLNTCLKIIFDYLKKVMTFSNPKRPSALQKANLIKEKGLA